MLAPKKTVMVGDKHRASDGLVRHLVPWLLLCALLLRGLIPGGFMPNLDPANGKGWLVICSSAGETTIAMEDDGDEARGPADTAHPGLCSFMTLALIGPVVLLLALLWPQCRDGQTLLWPALQAQHRRHRLCTPLGARAPPTILAAL